MTDREKLIELICECTNHDCGKRCNLSSASKCFSCTSIADDLIANGVTFATDTNDGGKWISVTEMLPEPGVVVLVHSKLGCTYFSHRLYHHLDGKPFCIEYSGGWEVTHWMPLPKPPKEE